MFPGSHVSRIHCFQGPMPSFFYVYRVLGSKGLVFPGTHVCRVLSFYGSTSLRVLCFQGPVFAWSCVGRVHVSARFLCF